MRNVTDAHWNPGTRNESFVSRLLAIRDEGGCEIGRFAIETESYQLPTTLLWVPEGSTHTAVFAQQSLADVDKPDQVRSEYSPAQYQRSFGDKPPPDWYSNGRSKTDSDTYLFGRNA